MQIKAGYDVLPSPGLEVAPWQYDTSTASHAGDVAVQHSTAQQRTAQTGWCSARDRGRQADGSGVMMDACRGPYAPGGRAHEVLSRMASHHATATAWLPREHVGGPWDTGKAVRASPAYLWRSKGTLHQLY